MLAQIEDAMLNRIAEVRLPYLRWLGSYGGEFEGQIPQVVRMLPGVWISCTGASAPQKLNTSGEHHKIDVYVSVFVAARAIRNEADSRKDSSRVHVGTYQMLNDIRALFTYTDLGINGVGCLRPGKTTSLFNGKNRDQGLSVFVQEWIAPYTLALREPGKRTLGEPYKGYLMPEGTVVGAVQEVPLPPLDSLKLCYAMEDNSVGCDIVSLKKGRVQ